MEDTKDFEHIYEDNQPAIYRFMFWRTKDQMLAQDLTSYAFEKAWRTRRNFTGGSAKAWLYRIAHTTLIDYWRKKKEILDDGTMTSQLEDDSPELAEVIEKDFAIEAMYMALKKLPTEMSEIVRLRFIEGLSAKDVGEKLGISEGNVRIIQYRALKKLRKYLQ